MIGDMISRIRKDKKIIRNDRYKYWTFNSY